MAQALIRRLLCALARALSPPAAAAHNLASLRRHALWLRLHVPAALLVTLLQRTPVVRFAAATEELVAISPLGAVLKSALAATASLGALHTLAGATTFVSSTPGPLSLKVGAAVPTVAFTVTDTINIASWKIGGALPPGVMVAAREGGTPLTGPGTLEAPAPMVVDPYDPYGGTMKGTTTTTPFLAGTPTQPGTFTVTFQAFEFAGLSGLASKTFNFDITVAADATPPANVAPAISGQPQSVVVAAGASATFTVAASGTPAPAIQWRKDGAAIAGATSATLSIPVVTAASAGSYTAVLTNAAGTVTSAAATLSLAPATPGTTPPSISAQPAAQTIASGSTVVFNVAASSSPAPTYQWRKDGAPIAGANGPTLVVSAATTAQAGAYSVAVSNGAATTVVSTPAALIVNNADATAVGRLANLSILTVAGSGPKVLTIGATIGGSGTSGALPLVIRAIGPTLATAFGLGGVLADPVMSINVAGNATPFATNDDWGGGAALAAAFGNVGAFGLPTNSLDAAIVPAAPGLAAGGYTVQVAGKGGASGTVIAELYDAATARTATTPRLTNLSTLTTIDAGANLAVGFVIGGTTARTLLVRGVGPTLGSAFGLGGTMADPKLELFNNATGAKIAENNDWAGDASLATTSASVGAFALANAASKDAVLLVTLAPGQYSARVSGADGGGGTAIVEVYEVP